MYLIRAACGSGRENGRGAVSEMGLARLLDGFRSSVHKVRSGSAVNVQVDPAWRDDFSVDIQNGGLLIAIKRRTYSRDLASLH